MRNSFIFLLLFFFNILALCANDEITWVRISDINLIYTGITSAYFSVNVPKNTGYWEGVDEEGNLYDYVIGFNFVPSDNEIFDGDDSVPFYTIEGEFAGYYRLYNHEKIYFEAEVLTGSGKTVIIYEPLGEPNYPEMIRNWFSIMRSFMYNEDPQAEIDAFNDRSQYMRPDKKR